MSKPEDMSELVHPGHEKVLPRITLIGAAPIPQATARIVFIYIYVETVDILAAVSGGPALTIVARICLAYPVYPIGRGGIFIQLQATRFPGISSIIYNRLEIGTRSGALVRKIIRDRRLSVSPVIQEAGQRYVFRIQDLDQIGRGYLPESRAAKEHDRQRKH
jgi:hypothetical protein